MGANCQSCGHTPQEVTVRTYMRAKDFREPTQKKSTAPTLLLGNQNDPSFSKFYGFS